MPTMNRPTTRIAASDADHCKTAPKVNSAPASSSVRLRPIPSLSAPPASEPARAPSVTQLVTTWTIKRLSEKAALIPGNAPEITPWSVAEQPPREDDDGENHRQPSRHPVAYGRRLDHFRTGRNRI